MKSISRLLCGLSVFTLLLSVAVLPLAVSSQLTGPSSGDGGGGTPLSPSGSSGDGGGGTRPSSAGIPNPLNADVNNIVDFLNLVLANVVIPLGVVVIVLLVMYSGYLFVTAQGNEKKIDEAKKTLLYVLIGAAILLGAKVIAEVIRATLCQIATC